MRTQPRTLQAVLLFLYGLLNILLFLIFFKAGDWAPLWAGARIAWSDPSALYDFGLITEAQRPIFGETALRPFIYPPSALLFIMPFAWLPFYVSFAAFIALTGFAYVREGFRIGAHWGLLLVPPAVLAALVGQTTLLVAALTLAALSRLSSQARAAGILLGLATAIKPSLFILAPVALIAGGHWRTLMFAGITGLGTIVASILFFGVQPWLAWIEAIPRFQSLFMAKPSFAPPSRPTPLAFVTALNRHGSWSALGLQGCWGSLLPSAHPRTWRRARSRCSAALS